MMWLARFFLLYSFNKANAQDFYLAPYAVMVIYQNQYINLYPLAAPQKVDTERWKTDGK